MMAETRKPGDILNPAWVKWLLAFWAWDDQKSTAPLPAAPTDSLRWIPCPACHGTGRRQLTVEEFLATVLLPEQLATLKSKAIHFVKTELTPGPGQTRCMACRKIVGVADNGFVTVAHDCLNGPR